MSDFILYYLKKNFIISDENNSYEYIKNRNNKFYNLKQFKLKLRKTLSDSLYDSQEDFIINWLKDTIRNYYIVPHIFIESCSVILSNEWVVISPDGKKLSLNDFLLRYDNFVNKKMLENIYTKYITEHAEWFTKYELRK